MEKYLMINYCDLYNIDDVHAIDKIVKDKGYDECDNKLSKVKFVSKFNMWFTSILFGLIGGDRLILGNKKLAITKFSVFFTIFISYFALLITGMVCNVKFPPIVEEGWYCSSALGNPYEYAMRLNPLIMLIYIIYAIVDAILCYKKAKTLNYVKAIKALI